MILRRLLFVSKVRPDLWCLHQSVTEAEFHTKATAIFQEWSANGVSQSCLHIDQKGDEHNLASYVKSQWVDLVPWWYAGLSPALPLVSTNNSLESTIKHTRILAGGVPAGAKQLAQFMLARVTAWSDDAFDALAERAIPKDLWLRAKALSSLFGPTRFEPCSIEENGCVLAGNEILPPM